MQFRIFFALFGVGICLVGRSAFADRPLAANGRKGGQAVANPFSDSPVDVKPRQVPVAAHTPQLTRPTVLPKPQRQEPTCPFCGGADTKIRFSDLYGEVSIRCDHEEDDAYEFAELDSVFFADSRIRTKEESGAILGLEDMSTFVLKPESILVIHADTDTRSNFERKFDMLKGRIIGNVKKMMEGRSLGFEMSQCVAGIKGTVFALEETGHESRAWLFTSKMVVTSKKTGETVALKPGQTARIAADGAIRVKKFDVKKVAKDFGIDERDLVESAVRARPSGRRSDLPMPEAERRVWERGTVRPSSGALLCHLSFDDYGNGGLNALKAEVGQNAVVRENSGRVVNGLGEVTCVTDRSVLAGLPAGDGAVEIPRRAHLALPIPSVLSKNPSRPYTLFMRVKFKGFGMYYCLMNMPAHNRFDALFYLDQGKDPRFASKWRNRFFGKGGFTPGKWEQITLQFREHEMRAFLNGAEIFSQTGELAGSRADCSQAEGYFLFSADNDGEDASMYWSDIKVFDGIVSP